MVQQHLINIISLTKEQVRHAAFLCHSCKKTCSYIAQNNFSNVKVPVLFEKNMDVSQIIHSSLTYRYTVYMLRQLTIWIYETFFIIVPDRAVIRRFGYMDGCESSLLIKHLNKIYLVVYLDCAVHRLLSTWFGRHVCCNKNVLRYVCETFFCYFSNCSPRVWLQRF